MFIITIIFKLDLHITWARKSFNDNAVFDIVVSVSSCQNVFIISQVNPVNKTCGKFLPKNLVALPSFY